jgi:hypothetical protein
MKESSLSPLTRQKATVNVEWVQLIPFICASGILNLLTLCGVEGKALVIFQHLFSGYVQKILRIRLFESSGISRSIEVHSWPWPLHRGPEAEFHQLDLLNRVENVFSRYQKPFVILDDIQQFLMLAFSQPIKPSQVTNDTVLWSLRCSRCGSTDWVVYRICI